MLRGNLDLLNFQWIIGWALDESDPETPVCLLITDNDVPIGRVLADQYRDDLTKAGIGRGRHAFEHRFQSYLSPLTRHVIRLRNEVDGAELPGGPFLLEPKSELRDGDPTADPPPDAPVPSTQVPQSGLRGNIDRLDIHGIEGWTQDERNPDNAVSLIVIDNEALVGRVLANRYRADLVEGGIGNGRHAFAFEFPLGLSPFERHVIELHNEADGAAMPGSPLILEPAKRFDADIETMISRALRHCGSEEDVPRKIAFLAAETDRLMQQLADGDSNRRQRAHHRRNLKRWARRLEEGAADPVVGEAPASGKRALVIDDRLPRLDRDAGSNAIMSHARSLQRLGYEVTFVPSAEFAVSESDRNSLDATGIACCGGPLYGSVEEVLRRQAGEFDVVYLHRIGNAAKYGELVREHFPRARRIFSVADLHHVRLARQAAIEDRPELAALTKRVRLAELVAAAFADVVITHSSFEAEVLRKQVDPKKVHVIPWSVGVRPTRAPFAQRHDFAFIGGFGHQPNADAARWLIGEIVPLTRKLNRNIECLLVGSELPAELAKLCGNGVTAVGHVGDLAEIFDRVRLTVAPLGYGAGVKGKVIDSLAAGIPCVCTPVAAEGLDLPQALNPYIVGEAAKIAKAIQQLHDDEVRNDACRTARLEYVASQLSEKRIDALMRAAVGAVEPQPATSSPQESGA